MHYPSFVCQGISWLAMQQALQHGRDHNPVLNLGDPRRCPGGILRSLFLRVRPHRSTQDDLAALHFDRDIPGIGLRITDERSLYLLLEVGWEHLGLDHDEIADAFDP